MNRILILAGLAALAAAPAWAQGGPPRLVASPEVAQKLQSLGWNGRYAENCQDANDVLVVPPPEQPASASPDVADIVIENDPAGQPIGIRMTSNAVLQPNTHSALMIALHRQGDGFRLWDAKAQFTADKDLPPGSGPAFPNGAKAGETAERAPIADGKRVGPNGAPGPETAVMNRCPG